MKKGVFLSIIITAIVAGGIMFFVGTKFAPNISSQDFQNLTPQQRRERLQQFGSPGTGMRNAMFSNRDGAFINGEIIAKDDKSITIKLRDGGSRIIFYSATTEISKFVSGTADDLIIGKNITVIGKTNSDNSITAQTIQLRPNIQNPTTNQN